MKGDGKLLITEATFGFACFVSVLVITVIIVTNRWYMGSYFFTQNVAKYTPHIACRATTMYCPIPVVIHYAVWVVFYSFLRSMTLLFCRIGIQSLTPSQLKMIWKEQHRDHHGQTMGQWQMRKASRDRQWGLEPEYYWFLLVMQQIELIQRVLRNLAMDDEFGLWD